MRLLLVISLIVFSAVSAEDKKTFNEAELKRRVEKEVNRQVDLIKKKSLSKLTKELLEREREISAREREIETKQEQVKMSEMSLLKKIEEFENNKTKVLGCIDKNRENEQLRVKQLVEVISNMKPQKAADLLSVQDSGISVKLIERIDPTKASKIFNLMDKEVSARLQKQYLNMQK